ncbi:hypothetical protein M8C13_07185 [Crossiella sp. SN42]|uniref:S16 family serine protease n=1 Tax=Crossiella sp. SN42 TaxID=2944808 RepID=UPI00207CA6CA|nr:S16 family serine protease [Crossiella sp. SN42]MCO1575541.1 hypothetical protein [Crossiella sp. SN42]
MPKPTRFANVELALANGKLVHVHPRIAGRVRGIDSDGDVLTPLGDFTGRIRHIDGTDYLIPLTPCCHARAQGNNADTGMYCRACSGTVSAKYAGPGVLDVAVASTVSTVSTVVLDGPTRRLSTLAAVLVPGPLEVILSNGFWRYGRELQGLGAALALCGQSEPSHRVEVHLDLPDFALPRAGTLALGATVAVVGATTGDGAQRLEDTAVLGELDARGVLHQVPGVQAMVQDAAVRGIRRVIVPAASVETAADVEAARYGADLEVLGVQSIDELAAWLRGEDTALRRPGMPQQPRAVSLTRPTATAIQVAADPMDAGSTALLADVLHGPYQVTWTLDASTAAHVRSAIRAAMTDAEIKARCNASNPTGAWYAAAAYRLRTVEDAATLASGGPFPTDDQ